MSIVTEGYASLINLIRKGKQRYKVSVSALLWSWATTSCTWYRGIKVSEGYLQE